MSKKEQKKTPVIDKVQGKMAGVLKKESWPNPRDREVMRTRKSGRNKKDLYRRL